MPTKLTLTESGASLTMHVAKCEVVEGKYGEDVKFTDTRGDFLFIPRRTADRQLLRCGFGEGEGETATVFYGDVDGTTLVFSRDPNKKDPSKPYWGIAQIVTTPSLTARAKAEAEKVRQQKHLPPDDDAPPPTDDDYYAEDDQNLGPPLPNEKVRPDPKALRMDDIDAAYVRAWGVAVATQGEFGTPETVENAAVSLLIAYQKAGII